MKVRRPRKGDPVAWADPWNGDLLEGEVVSMNEGEGGWWACVLLDDGARKASATPGIPYSTMRQTDSWIVKEGVGR